MRTNRGILYWKYQVRKYPHSDYPYLCLRYYRRKRREALSMLFKSLKDFWHIFKETK